MTGNVAGLRDELLAELGRIEARLAEPLHVTSGLREDGSHSNGWEVDLRAANSRARYGIVRAAILEGFTRIGVYDRHVHLGMDPDRPDQVLWTGVSS